MITKEQIRQKADKAFSTIVPAVLKNEDIFPFIIRGNKNVLSSYGDIKNQVIPIYEGSIEATTNGYSVEWKTRKINGTIQSVPSKIYFTNLDQYLDYTGRRKDYLCIEQTLKIFSKYPVAAQWLIERPLLLLKHKGKWEDIMKVADFFANHKPPYLYFIRELPITIHSKFIEQNVDIIKQVLDLIVPASDINFDAKNFSARYHLKEMPTLTHIRVLDEDLQSELSFQNLALSIEDIAGLKWSPKRVFVIENLTCYNTFPPVKNSVAIFGAGFKASLSKHFAWLKNTELFCWFDLDASGFQMLNMIRQYYPAAKSLMMCNDTFNTFQRYTVKDIQRKSSLSKLTQDEARMYDTLIEKQLRIEQEHIDHAYILHTLNRI